MKKSTRILEALEAANQPLTCAEIAAAIDEPDEAKSVGVMMCHLRSTARAEESGPCQRPRPQGSGPGTARRAATE